MQLIVVFRTLTRALAFRFMSQVCALITGHASLEGFANAKMIGRCFKIVRPRSVMGLSRRHHLLYAMGMGCARVWIIVRAIIRQIGVDWTANTRCVTERQRMRQV